MPSATGKFHGYSLRQPNINAHHLYLNNNDIINDTTVSDVQ